MPYTVKTPPAKLFAAFQKHEVRARRALLKLKAAEDQIRLLRAQQNVDPFKPIYNQNNISAFLGISKQTLHKNKKPMIESGCLGYCYSPYNCRKRMVTTPYLLNMYIYHRNLMFLGRMKNEGLWAGTHIYNRKERKRK